MSWKSLTLTLLISLLLFSGIVSMGMKYHWVDKINNSDKQKVELEIPQKEVTRLSQESPTTQDQRTHILEFQPVVLGNGTDRNHSAFSSMTKQQVIDYCTAQFQKSAQPHQEMALVVGDCVVSRYQDPYQEVNGEASSTRNRNN